MHAATSTADFVRDCHCIREFCLRLDRLGNVHLILDIRYPGFLSNLPLRRLSFLIWSHSVRLHDLRLSFEEVSFPSILLHRREATCIPGLQQRVREANAKTWLRIALWKYKLRKRTPPCFARARRRPHGMAHSQPHRFTRSSFYSDRFFHTSSGFTVTLFQFLCHQQFVENSRSLSPYSLSFREEDPLQSKCVHQQFLKLSLSTAVITTPQPLHPFSVLLPSR